MAVETSIREAQASNKLRSIIYFRLENLNRLPFTFRTVFCLVLCFLILLKNTIYTQKANKPLNL